MSTCLTYLRQIILAHVSACDGTEFSSQQMRLFLRKRIPGDSANQGLLPPVSHHITSYLSVPSTPSSQSLLRTVFLWGTRAIKSERSRCALSRRIPMDGDIEPDHTEQSAASNAASPVPGIQNHIHDCLCKLNCEPLSPLSTNSQISAGSDYGE